MFLPEDFERIRRKLIELEKYYRNKAGLKEDPLKVEVPYTTKDDKKQFRIQRVFHYFVKHGTNSARGCDAKEKPIGSSTKHLPALPLEIWERIAAYTYPEFEEKAQACFLLRRLLEAGFVLSQAQVLNAHRIRVYDRRIIGYKYPDLTDEELDCCVQYDYSTIEWQKHGIFSDDFEQKLKNKDPIILLTDTCLAIDEYVMHLFIASGALSNEELTLIMKTLSHNLQHHPHYLRLKNAFDKEGDKIYDYYILTSQNSFNRTGDFYGKLNNRWKDTEFGNIPFHFTVHLLPDRWNYPPYEGSILDYNCVKLIKKYKSRGDVESQFHFIYSILSFKRPRPSPRMDYEFKAINPKLNCSITELSTKFPELLTRSNKGEIMKRLVSLLDHDGSKIYSVTEDSFTQSHIAALIERFQPPKITESAAAELAMEVDQQVEGAIGGVAPR